MTSPARFTPDEWQVLLRAPDAVGMAVLIGHPDTKLRERQAFLKAWARSADEPFADSQIVLALIRGRDTIGATWAFWERGEEQLDVLTPETAKFRAFSLCRQAVLLLEGRATPQELSDYKAWVEYLARGVAEAEVDGGFLGFGGERVSEEEQAVLRELHEVLHAA